MQKYDGLTRSGEDCNPAGAMGVDPLIAELLTRFVKISAEQVDSEIRVSIRRIVESLGLDRGLLFQLSSDGTYMIQTHYWERPGCNLVSPSSIYSSAAWVRKKILRGEEFAFSTLEDLPEEAAKDKKYLAGSGMKSQLSLPMKIDGNLIGAMVMESFSSGITWTDKLVQKLMIVADLFRCAVERKRRKLELAEIVRYENLLTELSARFAMLASGEIDREIERSLKQIAELFLGEHCGIVELQGDRKFAAVTHAWNASDSGRITDGTNLAPLFPWSYGKHVTHGEVITFSSLAELPPEAERDRHSWVAIGVRSTVVIPIFRGGKGCHLIVLQNMSCERFWPDKAIKRLRLLGEIVVNVLTREDSREKLRISCDEIRAMKERIAVNAELFRPEVKLYRSHEKIIGQSDALLEVMELVKQVAPTDSTVLICGETGTGKELIARAIHGVSRHNDKVMVKVNCASLPAALIESELFGREKGAYTGALTRQIGRFEMAHESTIFLDEIAELSPELQAKLLRVLQDGEFERLGSPRTIHVQVRVISATNRCLEEEVKKGNFREDLYYRLNVFPITVPPLRERADDILMLVWAFLNEFVDKMGKKINKVTKRDMEALQRYSWPGNIRELRNVIERAVIVSSGDTLQAQVPDDPRKGLLSAKTLEEIEYQHINDVLRQTGGRIKGISGAARMLGLNPSTLYSRIQKLGINLRNEKGGISS